MFRALVIASATLLLAACGGDDGSPESTISDDQIEAWANEVWEEALPAMSTSLLEGCPEDPSQTPGLSIALTGSTSIQPTGEVIYDSQGALPDIPEEARRAVGKLLAEKIYEYCRSQDQ